MNGRISESKDILEIMYLDGTYFTMGALKIREKDPDLDEFGIDWKRKPRTYMKTYCDHGDKIFSQGLNTQFVSNNGLNGLIRRLKYKKPIRNNGSQNFQPRIGRQRVC